MNQQINYQASQIKVAALQMVSTHDVASNMQQAQRLVAKAAAEGAVIVVLPENFAVFDSQALYQWSQPEKALLLTTQVSSWAKACGVWIIAGTLPRSDSYPDQADTVSGKRVRASSMVFTPQGDMCARYDKIHLFDVDVDDAYGCYRESETIEPGTSPTLVTVHIDNDICLKIGLSICYDLRFPELYRELSRQGADILVVPAAFTWETGKAHWEPLLRARAIENQCFVVAANQGGQHSKTRQTWGHSMVIDPWGEVLAQQKAGEGVVMAVIDIERQTALRTQMPVLQHRRLSM
ncbi:MAG: carbon-nitrogen hydrolase [Gammaproteobacteria bacterium]|nr:MAG: carbon-nitrogen hydrolase [Gammaproteobacteria bacterium]